MGGRRLWPASGLALGCAVVSGCGRFTSHDSASGLRMVRVGPRLVPSPNEAGRGERLAGSSERMLFGLVHRRC